MNKQPDLQEQAEQSDIAQQVNPPAGFQLPVTHGDSGPNVLAA